MKMDYYIGGFTEHLSEALEIGSKTILKPSDREIRNILICGLGGSGIGGTILQDLMRGRINVPIVVNKNYSVPDFVDEYTLVIVSSYSGNTEETLCAMSKCESAGAEVACVSSGGKIIEICKEKLHPYIKIPEGGPPRAMFAYSFTQLFFILSHYNLIDRSFISLFKNSIALLDENEDSIIDSAKTLSKHLYQKTPIIYTTSSFEGVGIRFRQQLNENSKMLCWHHVVPEMNHNELLGWRTNTTNLAVVYFRNKLDYSRNQARININKEVIAKYTKDIFEVWISFLFHQKNWNICVKILL